jgi:hypothetical protein
MFADILALAWNPTIWRRSWSLKLAKVTELLPSHVRSKASERFIVKRSARHLAVPEFQFQNYPLVLYYSHSFRPAIKEV